MNNDDDDKIFNSNALISFDLYLPMSKFLVRVDNSMFRNDFFNQIQFEFTKYLCTSSFKYVDYLKDGRHYDIYISLMYIAHKDYYTKYILEIFPMIMIPNLILIIIDYSIEYDINR